MPAVSPVASDPVEVVDSALNLYEGIHPGISFRREVQTPLPSVRLDRDQMKRALTNLIDNAIAAMDGSGTVTLRARLVEQDQILRLEVEDDGPGIEPANKERLFVPYFSTKKRGTGLGLAIVNRIVSDHNGFIRVEDNQPRGTPDRSAWRLGGANAGTRERRNGRRRRKGPRRGGRAARKARDRWRARVLVVDEQGCAARSAVLRDEGFGDRAAGAGRRPAILRSVRSRRSS
jgi:hypothetical protein